MPVRTFHIQTLGCKVNHYESEQIAAVLRSLGLVQTQSTQADLRIVNTCSVTVDAASKSRQSLRKAVRLPVLQNQTTNDAPTNPTARVIATGCWATSDPQQAAAIPGVSAVINHHQDVAEQLKKILASWQVTYGSAPEEPPLVKRIKSTKVHAFNTIGTRNLPLLEQRQTQHQRAFLKIQDGCDAHCTYCIIPTLRPTLWSKPPKDVIQEARQMVQAGHQEIVLTGIFLGAYGHATALRRRQTNGTIAPLADLIDSLCTSVPGLKRLRLSSIEPCDLNNELLNVLASHEQIVPHFHLPLQSGSNELLRRMNRQYTQDDYLEMLEKVQTKFDRPALTTDIITGFPGETDEAFAQTIEVAEKAKFIHIHAFPFSPRPGTAAARWSSDFIPSPVASQRIQELTKLAEQYSLDFRNQFLGQTVTVMVERQRENSQTHHGRCERYFDIQFQAEDISPGDLVSLKIQNVTPESTFGTLATELAIA
jgi:threonylcarbamoyladenosine tRNA methylthiotransferase MtaB